MDSISYPWRWFRLWILLSILIMEYSHLSPISSFLAISFPNSNLQNLYLFIINITKLVSPQLNSYTTFPHTLTHPGRQTIPPPSAVSKAGNCNTPVVINVEGNEDDRASVCPNCFTPHTMLLSPQHYLLTILYHTIKSYYTKLTHILFLRLYTTINWFTNLRHHIQDTD